MGVCVPLKNIFCLIYIYIYTKNVKFKNEKKCVRTRLVGLKRVPTSSLLEVHFNNYYITSQNHKVQNIWFHSHQKLMDLVFLI